MHLEKNRYWLIELKQMAHLDLLPDNTLNLYEVIFSILPITDTLQQNQVPLKSGQRKDNNSCSMHAQ